MFSFGKDIQGQGANTSRGKGTKSSKAVAAPLFTTVKRMTLALSGFVAVCGGFFEGKFFHLVSPCLPAL